MTKDSRFEAQELTVRQARALLLAEAERNNLTQADPAQYDRYADAIFEDVTLHEMATICGVEVNAFDDLRESELRAVADDCIKANPFFFGMRERQRKQIADLMERNPDLIRSLMNPSD